MSEQIQPQPTPIQESPKADSLSYFIFKYIHIEMGHTIIERKTFGMIRNDEKDIVVIFDQKDLDDSTDFWVLKPENVDYGEMTFLDETTYSGSGKDLIEQLSEE